MGSIAAAIGTTVQKVKTAAAVVMNIGGRAITKAATDDFWTLSGTALAINQVCAFFLFIDSAGAASIQQSAIANASTNASYSPGAFEWPETTATKACVGAVLVKSGAAIFTPGTTSLAGVATYINVCDDYGVPIAY